MSKKEENKSKKQKPETAVTAQTVNVTKTEQDSYVAVYYPAFTEMERQALVSDTVTEAMRNPHADGLYYAQVDLRALSVDYRYQRSIDFKKSKLDKEFKLERAGTLLVNYRDGKFFVIDGNHRRVAAMISHHTHIGCLIYLPGISYEKEAEIYARQDDNKRNMSIRDSYKAGLECNDPICVKIKDICDKYRLVITTSTKGGNRNLSSLKTAKTIVYEHDAEGLDWIMHVLDKAGWIGQSNATANHYMIALKEVYYDGLLMNCLETYTDNLIKVLSKVSPTILQSYGYLRALGDMSQTSADKRVLATKNIKEIASGTLNEAVINLAAVTSAKAACN